MYEPFLDYARQSNEKLVNKIYLEKQIRVLRSPRLSIRGHVLMLVSDLLLAAGERIRPQEIKVYNEVQGNHCDCMYADLT